MSDDTIKWDTDKKLAAEEAAAVDLQAQADMLAAAEQDQMLQQLARLRDQAMLTGFQALLRRNKLPSPQEAASVAAQYANAFIQATGYIQQETSDQVPETVEPEVE